jgi:hypothetical protein
VLSDREKYERQAARVARIATAVLALSQALESARGPLTQQSAAVKVAGEGDPVLALAVQLLPDSAFTQRGVASQAELLSRWRHVSSVGRKAALVPADATVMEHTIGAVQATLLYPATQAVDTMRTSVMEPAASTVAKVTGAAKSIALQAMGLAARLGLSNPHAKEGAPSTSATGAPSTGSSMSDNATLRELTERARGARRAVEESAGELESVRAVFDRAQTCVDGGDFEGCLAALGPLTGYAAMAVREWTVAVQDRVEAERAVKLAKARAAVLTASMY